VPRDDVIVVDGRAYSWRALCDLRRAQREAARAMRGTQLALFELKDDTRPAHERTARGRYEEPGLLDWMGGPGR
jgi:hypothetical protein